MAIDFASYLPGVLPSVPACPRTTAINAIRDAARRLCSDAPVVKKTLAAVTSVVGQDIYTLPATTDMDIVSITYAEYDGVPIYPTTTKWLDANDYNWRNAGNAKPRHFFMPNNLQIQLSRKSDKIIAGALIVEVALKPSLASTSGDDTLYTDFKECIEHGAKHYLMQMPKKEWTDLALSGFHGKHFSYQLLQAISKENHGRNTGSVQAPMRFFA